MEQLPRESNYANYLIFHPLILVAPGMAQASLSTAARSHLLLPPATLVHPCTSSFSRREKGRTVPAVMYNFHVLPLSTARRNAFIHGFAVLSVNVSGTAVGLTRLIRQ
jgi:hypothetical protein